MERQNVLYRISLCLLLDIPGSEPLPGDISVHLGQRTGAFSKMGYAKNKFRTRVTDSHLAGILHISTSDLQPDIIFILKEMQHQPSH